MVVYLLQDVCREDVEPEGRPIHFLQDEGPRCWIGIWEVLGVGHGRLIGGRAWRHNDRLLGRGGGSIGLALLYAAHI